MRARFVLVTMSLVPMLGCGVGVDMGDDNVNSAGPLASEQAALTPSGAPISYAVDNTTIFANPERGFYHHKESRGSSFSPLSQSQLSSYRTQEGISLILRLFYLDAFRSGSISASYLSEFYRQFAVGRRSAVTLLHVDGHVVARHPNNAEHVGRDASHEPVFKGASLEA